MITGKEAREGMVDVSKEHVFISFSVEEIRDELSEYVWEFDKENEEYLGNPDAIVSNLWIEEAILEFKDYFNYEYDSWSNMRDEIGNLVVEKTKANYTNKTQVTIGNSRGGNYAS